MNKQQYTKDYMQTHDIDYFCIINGVPVHIASEGGRIPDILNNKEILQEQCHWVYGLPDTYNNNEIQTNDNKIEEIINDGGYEYLTELELEQSKRHDIAKEMYYSSFIKMAQKGFYSFGKSNPDNPEDPYYHIVARPQSFKRPASLLSSFLESDYIQKISIPELDFDKDISSLVNLKLVELIESNQPDS